jgi:hypothetical protein
MIKNRTQKVKHFVSHVGTNYMQEKLSLKQNELQVLMYQQ